MPLIKMPELSSTAFPQKEASFRMILPIAKPFCLFDFMQCPIQKHRIFTKA